MIIVLTYEMSRLGQCDYCFDLQDVRVGQYDYCFCLQDEQAGSTWLLF